MAHPFNPSTLPAEAGAFLCDGDRPGLHNEFQVRQSYVPFSGGKSVTQKQGPPKLWKLCLVILEPATEKQEAVWDMLSSHGYPHLSTRDENGKALLTLLLRCRSLSSLLPL